MFAEPLSFIDTNLNQDKYSHIYLHARFSMMALNTLLRETNLTVILGPENR